MKKKSEMRSVIFLDVDGVLNTRSSCVHAPSGIYVGVDEARVLVLANVMKAVCADGVVLTSTWKNMKEDEEDYIYLVDGLSKQGIHILGKTEEERTSQREEGILRFLELHPEIEEYVILDDQHYGFEDYRKLWENFIDTGGKGIENGVAASKTPSVLAILFEDAIKKYS